MDHEDKLQEQLDHANKLLDYAFDALNAIVHVRHESQTEYVKMVDSIAIDAIVMLGQDK